MSLYLESKWDLQLDVLLEGLRVFSSHVPGRSARWTEKTGRWTEISMKSPSACKTVPKFPSAFWTEILTNRCTPLQSVNAWNISVRTTFV